MKKILIFKTLFLLSVILLVGCFDEQTSTIDSSEIKNEYEGKESQSDKKNWDIKKLDFIILEEIRKL